MESIEDIMRMDKEKLTAPVRTVKVNKQQIKMLKLWGWVWTENQNINMIDNFDYDNLVVEVNS